MVLGESGTGIFLIRQAVNILRKQSPMTRNSAGIPAEVEGADGLIGVPPRDDQSHGDGGRANTSIGEEIRQTGPAPEEV